MSKEYFFVDFHIPSRLIPVQVYHFPEQSLYLFPSLSTCTLMQQIEDLPSLGVLFYGTEELLTSEFVSQRLADIVTMIGIMIPDHEGHAWLRDQWFNIHTLASRIRKTEAPQEEVQRRAHKQIKVWDNQGVQSSRDFTHVELSLGFPNTEVDLVKALGQFMKLDESSKRRHLIGLFFVATCSPFIIGRVYKNQNLKLSLLFSVLESLLPRGVKTKEITCRNCGFIHEQKMSMSIQERIGKLNVPDPVKRAFIKIYGKARNPFYHGAKLTNETDFIGKMKELGRDSFSFDDDIEHFEARFSGAHVLEIYLRYLLLQNLEAVH